MRDIRARIGVRGIELTGQQIQELAARRLESILDPQAIKPALLDQLKRNAAGGVPPLPQEPAPVFTFEETTLYESHRGILRFIRKLLNPILKLFFNPNPLVRALNAQSQINLEAAAREREQERKQAEWNALHYEILQRLVTEVSRVSIEMQSLALRVESLGAKVDFNDRRVRGLEGSTYQARPSRPADPGASAGTGAAAGEPASGAAGEQTVDVNRRRRRRRRGRRSGVTGVDVAPPAAVFEAKPEASAAADAAQQTSSGELPVAQPEPEPVDASGAGGAGATSIPAEARAVELPRDGAADSEE
jgi:hypothetical protein